MAPIVDPSKSLSCLTSHLADKLIILKHW